MRQVKVAVAGLGAMGLGYHCKHLARHRAFGLTAGFDTSRSRLKLAQKEYGIQPFTDWKRFLEDEGYELLVIATPSNFHARQTVDALNAGKHVVVEKPMCMTTREADRMIGAARKNRRMLSVFQNRRWDSDYLTVKRAVEKGSIGRLISVKRVVLTYSRLMRTFGVKEFRPHWRAERKYGGGLLFDFGAHYIDQLLQLVGSRPVDVYGNLEARVWTKDADDWFLAVIRFANGVLAQVEVCHISPLEFGGLHVFGTKGAICGNRMKALRRGRTREHTLRPARTDWPAYYRNIHKVLTRGEKLAVRPEEVRQVMQVMDAIRKSSAQRRVVKIA